MPVKVKELEMGAVIPTTQYGNLQPKFILEGGTAQKMKEEGLRLIQEVWDEYGEKPLKKKGEVAQDGIEFEQVTSFTGETILWSDYLHEYRSLDGTVLTSGSTYASKFEKPFDSAMLSEKSGNAWGVDKHELAALWKINGTVATDYGTAVHTALEMYHRFHALGAKVQEVKGLEENYALPKNQFLKKIVLDFVELFGADAESEVFITDVKNKMAGQIDRLQIIDMSKKVCRLGDYKTNFEMKKSKKEYYSNQLSFYAKALQNHGWTVEGLDLFHFDGELWHKFELEQKEINLDFIS